MPTARPTPEPTRGVPSEGTLGIRVRYVECDAMGFAHHSVYLPWMEMGRTELLREAGVTYADLEASGVLLVVTRLDVRYRSPARYDDLLTLTTRVERATRVKIEHAYELRVDERQGMGASDIARLRDGAQDLLFTGASTIACIGRDGRPAPLPEWLAGR